MICIRISLAGALIAAACVPPAAHAAVASEAYPSKPIRFLVGFPPGGGNDTIARMVGQKLSERFGKPVVIDNRPGAGGNMAAQFLTSAPADGHTILMISASHPIQGLLKKGLPYDPIRDFTGVSQLVVYRSVLLAHPGFGGTSLRDLIALAKSKPGTLNFASAGNGSASHLAGELLKYTAKVDMTHVPYKGTAQAVTDLLAGRVHVMFAPLLTAMPQLQSGKLRGLGVTTKNRSRVLPDVPAVAEAVPGYDNPGWYGIVAPPATPKRILDRLNAEVIQVLSLPDVVEKLQAEDMDIVKATPAHLDAVRKAELVKWTRVVKETGIQAD